MATDAPRFSDHERQLLERVAGRVVELRLEVPALLTLESARPLSLVAGQAMLFFEPLVQALFRLPDYRTFSALIERCETVDELARMIERMADDAHARRRAEKRAASPARKA